MKKYELNVTIEIDEEAFKEYAKIWIGEEPEDTASSREDYLYNMLDRIFEREFIDVAYVTGVRELKD